MPSWQEKPTRRVLIVSPHFPPVNAPDCQRARMVLPYLKSHGWDPHVLAIAPDRVEAALDDDLVRTIPPDVPITRSGGWRPGLARRLGFGGLWLRTGRSFQRAGDRLLASGAVDLVYFTTTIFSAMTLGRRWRNRFGVPYVLDIQDPWVTDYYIRTGSRPPGGPVRYAVSQWRARRQEPPAVSAAAHVTAVSPAYPDQFRARYPDIPADRFTVLPFAAAEADFEAVRDGGIRQSEFDPADGCRHWVYLGRVVPGMSAGIRALFIALARLRAADSAVARLRLHFVGTNYAPTGLAREEVMPLARDCGVADLVSERTARLPYLEGLNLLEAADVVLIVGSDDPGYSASKVYPCIAAGRPILSILHETSPAGQVITECRAGEVVRFDSSEPEADLAGRVAVSVSRMLGQPLGYRPDTDWAAFEPFTARAMTRRLCEIFDRVARRPR